MAVTPIDRPLALGELLAETTRIYRERVRAALALGALLGLGFIPPFVAGPYLLKIVLLAPLFTVFFAAGTRLVAGDSLGEAFARIVRQAPSLAVLTVAVSLPFAMGNLDPIILVLSVFWLGLTGFAIPVVMVEDEAGESWIDGLGRSMTRSLALARAEYLHAVGVIAALVFVYFLFGRLLAAALVGFADNRGVTVVFLVQLVLGPFFFLGLGVLFFDQRARAAGARPPH